MPRCLYLVPLAVNQDTIQVLERLLQEARAGRILGLAYVALHHQHEYSADMVGSALESPLLSRGICRALEDVIAQKR